MIDVHCSSIRYARYGLVIAVGLTVTGCANMSGIGGSSTYGCKAPEGVKCESVSGNYYNAVKNNLPSQRRQNPPSRRTEIPSTGSSSKSRSETATQPTMRPISLAATGGTIDDANEATISAPLRSQARVLRLWYKPWEDTDHDLYSQGYVYVQVDDGHWLIEHAQRQIREAYAPVQPPRSFAAPTNEKSSQPPIVRPQISGAAQDSRSSVTQSLRSLQDRGKNNITEDGN
jgi:conjugal transfer pilus assembly protein TraV